MSSSQNTSLDDESLLILNTAVCHPLTPTTTDQSTSVDVTAPSNDNDESVLMDLKLGVSVPVSLAAGVLPTETAAVSVVPKSEKPVDHVQCNPPVPAVNPQALCALEMLLGMCRLNSHILLYIYSFSLH